MKTYYYYASQEMDRFDEPQDEKFASCQLTEEMIRLVVSQCAIGSPPFKAFIPSWIAWQFHTWNVPPNLIDIKIVPGKSETDISPCDTAKIIFEDVEVVITCRRVKPMICECWDYGVVKA